MERRAAKQSDFLLSPVRLDPQFASCEQMRANGGTKGDLRMLFADPACGVQVFVLEGKPHALFRIIMQPGSIFEAVGLLMNCVGNVEQYDIRSGQRRKVFEFESFARFFQTVESAYLTVKFKSASGTIQRCLDFEHPNLVRSSKILVFLLAKVLLLMQEQNLLADEQYTEQLGRLQLPKLKMDFESVIPGIEVRLREVFSGVSNALHKSQAYHTPDKSQLIFKSMDPLEFSRVNSFATPSPIQTKHHRTFFTGASPTKSGISTESYSVGRDSRTQAFSFLSPESLRYKPFVSKPTPRLAKELFDYGKPVDLAIAKIPRLSTVLGQFEKAFQSIPPLHFKDPEQLRVSLKEPLLILESAKLGLANRVQLLLELTESFLLLVQYATSKTSAEMQHEREKFILTSCNCPSHALMQLYFCNTARLILDPQTAAYGEGNDKLSALLITLETPLTIGAETKHVLLNRMLHVLDSHQDDLKDRLDTDVPYLLKANAGKYDILWYFKAQIAVRHLKEGIQPKQLNPAEILKFLNKYVEIAGPEYLAGEHRAEYLEEFLACCAQTENLLGFTGCFESFDTCDSELDKLYQSVLKIALDPAKSNSSIESRILSELINKPTVSSFARIKSLSFLDSTSTNFGRPEEWLSKSCGQINDSGLVSFLDPIFFILESIVNYKHDFAKPVAQCLKIGWTAWNLLDGRNKHENEISTYLCDIVSCVSGTFSRFCQNRGSLFQLKSRLEHKEHYFKFFSDAVDAGSGKMKTCDLQQLRDAFDELHTIATKEAEIRKAYLSLQKLETGFLHLPEEKCSKNKLTMSSTLKDLHKVHSQVMGTHPILLGRVESLSTKFFTIMLKKYHTTPPYKSLTDLEVACLDIQTKAQNAHSPDLVCLGLESFQILEVLYSEPQEVEIISEQLKLDIAVGKIRYGLYKLCQNVNSWSQNLEELVERFIGAKDRDIVYKIKVELSSAFDSKTNELSLRKCAEILYHLRSSIQNPESKIEIIRTLVLDQGMSQNMVNVAAVIDHFEGKNSSHFQQIIFSSEFTLSGLLSSHVNQLEALTNDLQLFKNLSKESTPEQVVKFVRRLSLREFNEDILAWLPNPTWFSQVYECAENLIRVSEVASQGLDKGAQKMQNIMAKSRIVFEYDNPDKPGSTSVDAHWENVSALQDPTKQEPQTTAEQAGLKEMKAIQTQMIIIESAESNLRNRSSSKTQNIDTSTKDRAHRFVQIVECCENIKHSLDQLMNLGLILDLPSQINCEISGQFNGSGTGSAGIHRSRLHEEPTHSEPEELRSSSLSVSKSQQPYTERKTRILPQPARQFECSRTTLVVALDSDGALLPNIDHLLTLAQVLAKIVSQCKAQLVHEGPTYHQINLLPGIQKLRLAQYFSRKLQNPENLARNIISDEIAETLFQFATSISPNVSLVDNQTSQLSGSTSESIFKQKNPQTLDILSAVFSQFDLPETAKIQDDPTPDSGEAENDYAHARMQVLFKTYKPVEVTSELLQVLAFNMRLGAEPLSKSASGNFQRPHFSKYFFATAESTEEDILEFLVRAAQDPKASPYFMVDLHFLPSEVSQTLTTAIVEVFFSGAKPTCNHNLILLLAQHEVESQLLVNEWKKHPRYFSELKNSHMGSEEDLTRTKLRLLQQMQTCVVWSKHPGLGKSSWIQTQAEGTLITVNLGGDLSLEGIERRLRLLQVKSCSKTGDEDITLHFKLDTVDNFDQNHWMIDRLLFSICFLRCVQTKTGFLSLPKVTKVYLELQNTSKALYLDKVSVIRSLMNTKIVRTINEDGPESKLEHQMPSPTSLDSLKESFDLRLWELDNEVEINADEQLALTAVVLGYPADFSKFDYPNADASGLDILQEFQVKKAGIDHKNIVSEGLYRIFERVGKRVVGNTFLQIKMFIKLSFLILQKFAVSKCLSLKQFKEKANAEQIKNIREQLINEIFIWVCHQFWGTGSQLLKESANAASIAQESQADQSKITQLLEEYSSQTSYIPKWNEYDSVASWNNLSRILIKVEPLANLEALCRELQLAKFPNSVSSDKTEDLLEHLVESLRLKRSPETLKNTLKEYQHGKGFNLTLQTFSKIMLLHQRAEAGLPIIIMGPTGCGKTYLVTFAVKELMQEQIEIITIHPGVTEDKLKDILLKGYNTARQLWDEAPVKSRAPRVWILFDEFNTSPLQCLVAEVMLTRKATFHEDLMDISFPSNLVFVGCCNPYKIKTSKQKSVGLTNPSASSVLSHRVYPIPSSLMHCVWRYDIVDSAEETKHVQSTLNSIDFSTDLLIADQSEQLKLKDMLLQTVVVAHQHFRNSGCENSVSLRDLSRFIELFKFFTRLFNNHNQKAAKSVFGVYDGLVVGTQYCYILRLESSDERITFYSKLQREVPHVSFTYEERFTFVLDKFADEIQELEVDIQGAALNRPLKENLLALWACLINQIPLLICGKPGTSKTLAITIIEKALGLSGQNGRVSSNSLHQNEDEPNVAMIDVTKMCFFSKRTKFNFNKFWGTETTTSHGVENAFLESKLKFEESSTGDGTSVGVALVFDEIGLAEISPHNPLKVLHEWLEPEKRTFSFVGLSNWQLDASKMNRVLYLARLDMEIGELKATCRSKLKKRKMFNELEPLLEALAKAYVEFRASEVKIDRGHRNFHGSRDFYATISCLERSLVVFTEAERQNMQMGKNFRHISIAEKSFLLMQNAISRNFCPKIGFHIMDNFTDSLSEKHAGGFLIVTTTTMDLIYQNLLDDQARHLMIFSKSSGVEELMIQKIRDFQINVRNLEPSHFVYLSQKKGKEDMISTMMTQLPVYTKNGYTLVMKNIDDVYGCMYDLLNKSYFQDDKRTKQNKCLLFYEGHKDVIEIHPQFKIILLMDDFLEDSHKQHELEKILPAPLLNRFEKYFVGMNQLMTKDEEQIYRSFTKCFDPTKRAKGRMNPLGVLHNLSDELILSTIKKYSTEDPFKANEQSNSFLQVLLNIFERSVFAQSTPRSSSRYEFRDPGTILRSTQTDLIRLFSRNSILMESLKSDEYINYSETKEKHPDAEDFKTLFMDTHQFESLEDLAITILDSKTTRKVTIFTYSSPLELAKYIGKIPYLQPRIQRFEAKALNSKNLKSQGTLIRQVVSDPTTILLVYFEKKSDWSYMQYLRYSISTAEGHRQKRVIFACHYAPADIYKRLQVPSPLSYLTNGWEMMSMDSLEGCHYEECFRLVETPLSEWHSQGYKLIFGNDINEYFRNIVKQGLRQMVMSKSTLDHNSSNYLRAADLICSISELVNQLADQVPVEITEHMELKLGKEWDITDPATCLTKLLTEELTVDAEVPTQPNREDRKAHTSLDFDRMLFKEENDMFVLIGNRYRAYVTDIIQIRLIPERFPDKFIRVAVNMMMIPAMGQNAIRSILVSDSAIPEVFENIDLNKDLEFDPEDSFADYMAQQVLNLTDAMSKSQSVQDKKAKFDQIVLQVLLSKDQAGFSERDEILKLDQDPNTKGGYLMLKSLQLLITLQKNAGTWRPNKSHNKLIIQTAYDLLTSYGKPDLFSSLGPMYKAVWLLNQVFSLELEVLSIHIEKLNPIREDANIREAAAVFVKQCQFPVDAYIERLLCLSTVNSAEHIQQIVEEFELGIKLSKKRFRPQKETEKEKKDHIKMMAHRENFLNILRWMSKWAEGKPGGVIRGVYNEYLRKKDPKSQKKPAWSVVIVEMLERFTEAGISRDIDLKLVEELLHDTLEVLHRTISSEVKIESLARFFGLVLKRFEMSFDTRNLQHSVTMLGKTFFKLWDQHEMAISFLDLMQAKISGSELLNENQKRDFFLSVNFQLVNGVQKLKLLSTKASEMEEFLDYGISTLRLMLAQEPKDCIKHRILNRQEIITLRQLKHGLRLWARQDGNVDTIVKRALESLVDKCLNQTSPETWAYLLLQAICLHFGNNYLLQMAGFEVLPRYLDVAFPETFDVYTSQTQKQEMEQNQFETILKLPRTAERLYASTYTQRRGVINWTIFAPETTFSPEHLAVFMSSLVRTPKLQEAVAWAKIQADKFPKSSAVGIGALIALTANLAESVRASFVFHASKLTGGPVPQLMSGASRGVKQSLSALYYKEHPKPQSEQLAQNGKWSRAFRCSDPTCGQLYLLGEDQTPETVFGPRKREKHCRGPCNKPILDWPAPADSAPGLVELSKEQMESEKHLQPADTNIHESYSDQLSLDPAWICSRYPEIPDLGSAALLEILNYLFTSVAQGYASAFASLPDQSPQIVKCVSLALVLSPASALKIVCLVIDDLKDEMEVKQRQIETPEKLRACLVEIARKYVKNPHKALRLHEAKHPAQDELSLKKRFIAGNLPFEQTKKLFPDGGFAEISLLLQPLQDLEPSARMEFLESQVSLEPEAKAFIADVHQKYPFLESMRALLTPIRNLSNMLSHKFNRRFTQEECLESETAEMIEEPSGRNVQKKLTLNKLIDGSYYGLRGAKDKPKNATARKSLLEPSKKSSLTEIQNKLQALKTEAKNVLSKKILKSHRPEFMRRLAQTIQARMKPDPASLPRLTDRMLQIFETFQESDELSLISCLVAEGRAEPSADLHALQVFLELWLQDQRDLLSTYTHLLGQRVDLPPKKEVERSFFDSSDENLMQPDFHPDTDLADALGCRLDLAHKEAELVLDARYLVLKWHRTLFADTLKLCVRPNYTFNQTQRLDLYKLSLCLSTELGIRMDNNRRTLLQLKDLAEKNKLDLVHERLAAALSEAVHSRRGGLSEDTPLTGLLPEDMLAFEMPNLLSKCRLKHVEAIRQILVADLYERFFKILALSNLPNPCFCSSVCELHVVYKV